MKLNITLFLILFVGIVNAQKREIRKINNAVRAGDMDKALTVFNSINESDVENKYLSEYNFYKSVKLIGIVDGQIPTLQNALVALKAFDDSKKAGFKAEGQLAQVEGYIKQVLLQLASQSLQDKNIYDALAVANALIESEPDNMDILFDAANIAYQAQEFSQATTQYQKLYDVDYSGERSVYVATNKVTNKEESFSSKTLRDVSLRAGTHVKPLEKMTPSIRGSIVTNLAWLYKNNNEMEKAKSLASDAFNKFPNDKSLLDAQSNIYLILDEMDKYSKSLKSSGKDLNDPAVYDNLGNAALKDEKYDIAIENFKKSLKVEGDNFNTLTNLGLSYIRKGNLDKTSAKEQNTLYLDAIELYKKAHKLDSTNEVVIKTLISLYDSFEMTKESAAMKGKL